MSKSLPVENIGNGINIELSVTLGTASLRINQLLKLGRGAVVELDRGINDFVDIYANDILIGHGEVVITEDESIGIAITDIPLFGTTTTSKTFIKPGKTTKASFSSAGTAAPPWLRAFGTNAARSMPWFRSTTTANSWLAF